MKTNNGKLLAAVVAMLMIVCAVAVVASPATAEDAVVEKPTYDFSAVEPIEIGGDKTVAAALGDAYDNGVLTVTEDMVLNITGTVGSSTAPAIEQIVLNGGDLQITGTGVIYIGTDATQNDVSVVAFQQIGVLQITGAVKVNFDAAGTNCHIFNNSKVTALVSVTNGAELNITQTGSKGASWYNSDETANTETFLDVDGATVNLTNAHSIQGAVVSATNSATITVDNERDVTGITLKDGSVIDNSKITVTKSGYSGVLVKGTVKLNNSASIEVKESGVFGDDNKYPGINMSNKTWGGADVTSAIVMDDTSSVTTTSIGVCHENSSETLPSGTATITGGTFTGAFAQGNNSTAVSYTLNTTIAGSSSADSNVTINGVAKVTGTLDASDATVAGKLIAMPKSNVTVETNDADNVTAMAGSTVNNVVTSPENVDYEVTVTTFEEFAAYATIEGMEITVNGKIELSSDVTLADGVKVTVPVENKDFYIDVSDADLNVVRGAAFNGRAVAFDADGQKNVAVFSNVSGNYTISAGSVIINGDVTCKDGVITVSNDVVISGSLSGDLKVTANTNGDVIFKDFTVNAGATLDLGANVTFSTEGKFNLYGSIIADAAVNLKVGTSAASEFTGYPGAVISQNVSLVTGNDDSKINLDDSLKNMEISVDITGNQVYSQMQNVTIVTSLDITPHASLKIMGQLVINEGVTLTIQENAKLIISSDVAKMIVNGTIEVEGDGQIIVENAESVTVAGTITSEGTVDIDSKGKVTVKENGSIYIDDAEGSILTVDNGLTINAGGSVEVRGQMDKTSIINKGTVTLNGAVLNGDVTVNQAADGAVVDIKSFTSSATGTSSLTITDAGLILKDNKDTDDIVVGTPGAGQTNTDSGYSYAKPNEITFTANSGEKQTGIRGITVTETVTSEKDENDNTKYTYGMELAGSVSIANDGDTQYPKYTVQLTGVNFNVAAETTLTVGAGITLDNDAVLNVAGTVYAVAGSDSNDNQALIDNSGTINVTGMVETVDDSDTTEGIEVGTVNAVKYEADVEGNTHYYYTTLATAIANGAEEIYVIDEITILENVTIPTGVTVRADGGTSVINIGDADHRDVVVTVTAGATVRGFTGGINVDATLEFQDIGDSKGNNAIVSDVQVDADPARTYTNIYTALNNAESGETVTITRTGSNVVLTDDIEVKTGVTLEIPNSKTVEIENGVTLTVNGTVKMIGEIVGQTGVTDAFNPMSGTTEKDADDYATIVVNGTLMSMDPVNYASTDTEIGYYIAGAYYNVVDSTGNYWYVTPVSQAAAVSNNVEGGIIEIYGDNTVADVAFTGDADQAVYVNVQAGATLTAGTVTLSYAQIALLVDGAVNSAFTGTIASAVGSVELVNATNFTVVDALDSDDAEYIAVSGVPAKADADGVDATMTVASGNVSVVGDLTIYTTIDSYLESFEIASGATMTVTGTDGDFSADSISVDGTLVAIDNGTVDVTGVLTVRGTFTVAEKTDDNDAGSANIRTLFVGIAQDEDFGWYTDASAATVNADNLGANLQRIVVSADSTISGDLTKNMSSTEFYVEDALWLTVYVTNSNGNYIIDYGPGVPTESYVTGWNNADGKKVENETIGTTGYEQVYAQVNYNVYEVVVYIDNGIGDVAIDGQLLVSNNAGGYYLPNGQKLTSGQHTITYTLKPNFEGTPTLVATGDVATVSGLTFTLSGGYYDFDAMEPNTTTLTLSGTTPSDTTVVIEGGDNGGSDMGLTDYLLIILVILIVIMAIIVALRLMRS